MTDPIHLPIELIQLGDDGSASMAVIDADLARRIVALAGIPMLDTDFIASTSDRLEALEVGLHHMGVSVQPVAPQPFAEDAAVEALCNAYRDVPLNSQGLAPLRQQMENLLAAIKAGKVPGVRCDVWAGQTQEIIAQRGRELVAFLDTKQQLDKALADLAACRDSYNAAIDAAQAYCQQHIPDLPVGSRYTAAVVRDALRLRDDLAAMTERAEKAEEAHAATRAQLRAASLQICAGDALTAQRDRLAGLLRSAKIFVALHEGNSESWLSLEANIDAALAEQERKP